MTLAKEIFGKKQSWLKRWDAAYSHETLEACLKTVIRNAPLSSGIEENEPMESSSGCKTFVITTELEKDSFEPTLLRSYSIPQATALPQNPNLFAFPGTIWEAGRATSAAPTFFKPITLHFETTTHLNGKISSINSVRIALHHF